MAGWLIDITSHSSGGRLPYEAKKRPGEAALDDFWYDAQQDGLYFPKHVTELLIFGELCCHAFTAEHTGKLRLGYIDPILIDDPITDPENVKAILGVIVSNMQDNEKKTAEDNPAQGL